MKVLHVINDLATGGAERLVVNIASEQCSHGIDSQIAVLNSCRQGIPWDMAQQKNLTIYELGRSRFDLMAIGRLIRLAEGFDVVHAHLFPAFYWSLFARRPVRVVTEHSTSNKRRHSSYQFFDKLIYRGYDQVCAISDGVARSLAAYLGVGVSDILVVLNGIDRSEIPTRHVVRQHRSHSLRLLAVGTLDSRKNFGLGISAVAQTADCRLTIVGRGPERDDLQERARNLGVANRVTFLGERNDVLQLMADADALLVTSTREGFGLVAAEALAVGLPIVAPALDGLSEVIGHSGAGVYYTASNITSCAAAIDSIMDPKIRHRMSEQSYKRSALFDVKNTARQYEIIYQDTLGRHDE